jgi:flavorubredoxin
MNTIKIVDGLHWVGAVDWDARDFHGHSYSVHRGTTYNAYLIIDEKITLVDSVYTPFADELIARVSELVDPSKIDYIVANHVEVDHSGSLARMAVLAPKAEIICTKKGEEGFRAHFGRQVAPHLAKPADEWHFRIVKTGDELNIGKKTLTFIEAPFLHWPDSMFTYIKEDAVLLSNDAFGQHLASSGRFDDEVEECVLMEEAAKYFANILTPFAPLILKKLDEVAALKIPIKMICPSHGIMWRKDPAKILDAYKRWSLGEYKKKILIVYDTMWGATEKMARAILEGAESVSGVEVKLFKMPVTDRSDVIKELLDARAIIVGSSTINKGMLPTMAPLLEDLEGLRFKNKIGATFGAFGWSGGAVEAIEARLKKSGVEIVHAPIISKWIPDAPKLAECEAMGREIAVKTAG